MKAARAQVLAGLGLAVLAAAPQARDWLEASMVLHMLVQIPALVLAGCLLAAGLPARTREGLQGFNGHGLTGWTLASLALAFWMLPRALDLAAADARIDAAKIAVLLLAGLGLRLSLAVSRPVVQLFFVGNWAWMTASIGLLYVETPTRLCNTYLIDDQAWTGYGLIAQAIAMPVLWGALAIGHNHRDNAPPASG
jgi:hypothetical protein